MFACLAPSTSGSRSEVGGRIRGFSLIGSLGVFDPRNEDSVESFERETGISSRPGRKNFLDELVKVGLVEKRDDAVFALTSDGQKLRRGLLALVDTYDGKIILSSDKTPYYPFVDVHILTDGKDHTEWIWNVSMTNLEGKLTDISWWAQSETVSMPPNLFRLKSYSSNIKDYEMELDDPMMKRFKLKFTRPQTNQTHYWYTYDWPRMFLVGTGTWDVKFHFMDYPIRALHVSIHLPHRFTAKNPEYTISPVQPERSIGLGDFITFDPSVVEAEGRGVISWTLVNVPSYVQAKLAWKVIQV
jgi:hypothetical protein